MTIFDSICIIGIGSIGKKYLSIFKKYFKFKKIILLRSGKNKSIFGKNIYEVKKLSDVKKHKPQAVVISNPTSLHIKYATYFCKQKIPLFIEKPISNNLKGIQRLKQIQKQNKTRIQVGYVLKFKKEFEILKKILKNRKILNVNIICKSNLKNWRKNKNYKKFNSSQKKLGGGVLLELSHEIDYARQLFGEISKVFCKLKYSKDLKIDVEDKAHIILLTKSNILIDMYLSFSSKETKRVCKIQTSKSYIIWDLINNSISIKNKLIYKKNEIFHNNYINQLNYFFKNIKKFKQDIHSLDNSIETLKVVLASKLSDKEKKIVNF